MSAPETLVAIGETTIDAALAPADRTFRDAWQLDGEAVTIDMATAREIQRDAIRAERRPRLLALDAQWFQAAEDGDTAAQTTVKAAKQALRDAPEDTRIETAMTPEDLKALTLDALLVS